MDEVNACIGQCRARKNWSISRTSEPRPRSGERPFTVEAVQPQEMSLGNVLELRAAPEFGGAPERHEEISAR